MWARFEAGSLLSRLLDQMARWDPTVGEYCE